MKKRDPIPQHLSADARKLWQRLCADYVIDDAGGLALLRAACEAFDRSEGARQIIARDGPIVSDKYERSKAHPAVAIERDARGQMIAALRALKLAPGEQK